MPFKNREDHLRYHAAYDCLRRAKKTGSPTPVAYLRYCLTKEYRGKFAPIQRRLLVRAKNRAKKAGIPFNLTFEDIVVPEKCPYLGISLKFRGSRGLNNSASLDRVDPRLGYTKGNVEVISNRANTLKNNASKEELLTFAKNIILKFGGNDE